MTFDTTAFWSRASKYLMRTGIPYSPIIITKAKGTVLTDSEGNELLDFTSGQMATLLGHCHPEVSEVVAKYAAELDHLMALSLCPPVVDFAENLARILPAPLEKSFLLSTGGESVEAAIRIAKCATGKFEIVAFSAGYHGMTGGAASATFSIGRKHNGPVLPGGLLFPTPNGYRSPFRKADGSHDWEAEMDFGWAMIDAQSVGSLAAFIFEPILSAGGIIEPPQGYFKRLEIGCKKRGMLLIADEAQTGLGRLGTVFGFERDGIVPDILALSKTIGCGLPVASVSTSAEIEKRALEGGFLFVTTHYNDPLPAAVASKVIEIVIRDDYARYAKERGAQLVAGLKRLQEKYWCIGEIRGRGLLIGIELISDPVTKAPGAEISLALTDKAIAKGLSVQPVAVHGHLGLFRLAPPLTVSVEEVDKALQILNECFAEVFPQGQYQTSSSKALPVESRL